jgi:hypothetical protein
MPVAVLSTINKKKVEGVLTVALPEKKFDNTPQNQGAPAKQVGAAAEGDDTSKTKTYSTGNKSKAVASSKKSSQQCN